jgi:hypothetical protein
MHKANKHAFLTTEEGVFHGVHAEELSWRQLTLEESVESSSSREAERSWHYSWVESVEGSAMECQPVGNGRISIAKIRYQKTSSEDTAEE